MKRIVYLVLFTLTLLVLTSCTDNKIYNHLSNQDNYDVYIGEIREVKYLNDDGILWSIDFIHSDLSKIDNLQTIVVNFSETEIVENFIGRKLTDKEILNGTYTDVEFTLIETNSNHLLDNGFLNDIEKGSTVSVTVSSFIYKNKNYFQLVGLSIGYKVYLNSDIGISNLIKYMDKNKI